MVTTSGIAETLLACWTGDLAARAVREEPLAVVHDLVTFATALEEVHPRPVELVLALVVERFVRTLRRPVGRREELPVRLPVGDAKGRVVLRELEVERIVEQFTDVLLVPPREGAAHAFGRRRQEGPHHPEHLREPALGRPAAEREPASRLR